MNFLIQLFDRVYGQFGINGHVALLLTAVGMVGGIVYVIQWSNKHAFASERFYHGCLRLSGATIWGALVGIVFAKLLLAFLWVGGALLSTVADLLSASL